MHPKDFVRTIDHILLTPSSLPRKWVVCVIGEEVAMLPKMIRSRFHAEIVIGAPDREARSDYLKRLLNTKRHDLNANSMTLYTAGYLRQDLEELILAMQDEAIEKWISRVPTDYRMFLTLTWHHFENVLNSRRKSHTSLSGTVAHIPQVFWEDVGGLTPIKQDILDMIELPLRHTELFADNLRRRSGLLLYGPPGTGKTLLAKAVATECHINFISVKGPELLNMYVGESERQIRELFIRAKEAKPCVVFFDEIDALAPRRGRSGDSGGVSDRMVSQLLAELDSIHLSQNIFLIGATNRPDLVDPALLRPGRFDKLLYLGLAEDHESQYYILKALTRQLHLAPDCDLSSIVRQCPFSLSGADFYALTMDALMNAIRRKLIDLEQKASEASISLEDWIEEASEESLHTELCEADFLQALARVHPSISSSELKRYQSLRDSFLT
jgi:peroxin-6